MEDFNEYCDYEWDEQYEELTITPTDWDDEVYLPEELEKMKHLANIDYTLNSPLISDNIDAFIEFLSTGSCPAIFKRPGWVKVVRGFHQVGLRVGRSTGSSTFHGWCVRIFKMRYASDLFSNLLSSVDSSAQATFVVPKSFITGWLGEELNFTSRTDMKADTYSLGAKHLLFHTIILSMNCVSKTEAKYICKLNGASYIELDEDSILFDLSDNYFGRVVIMDGFVWFSKFNQLADRNMILMVKDVLGGRFQTMLHLEYKEYPSYPEGNYESIRDLFDHGDSLIELYGSEGYKIIKMLEPLSINQIHERSSKIRPRIPTFVNFSNHLNEEIQELEILYPGAQQWADVIRNLPNIPSLLTSFGSFRLWGHPFVRYFDGLVQMHENVTLEKNIDTEYAAALASDFVKTVLSHKFKADKTWYVDLEKLADKHPLRSYIENNTWPSTDVILAIGDIWDKLPITKCFEIPDAIDPSLLYSDKSHSKNLSDIIQDILTTNGTKPITTLSVLESYLSKSATNVKEFLQMINDVGLKRDSLVIGLRAKERELKLIGRFFALMSWELREYFVLTEYIIKKHYVPLCQGLTMTDDFNTVTEKMLSASAGQSTSSYEKITIANHVDYTKWNNHQRGEANDPIFRAMGQFLGLPNLFSRTHEFFQNSLFYYKDRPDLMDIRDGEIFNRTDQLVCWRGQAGGCEGLRQSGWSVVNYFSLLRQSKVRNTTMKYLMQGDNQVICTFYKVRSHRDTEELEKHLEAAHSNNEAILTSIREGTAKLGLIFNEDETLQSAQVMIYGKVILINGNITGLPEKRLARILCTTNDQVPSVGSVSATVVTNILTLAHFSDFPINACIQYNWLANYARRILELHNPAIRGPVTSVKFKNEQLIFDLRYWIRYLYLDPSIGGVGGLSLNRILIRQFPDQVTESLSFWKFIYHSTDDRILKQICEEAGYPQIAEYESNHFRKLIENPTGLNLKRGINVLTRLRSHIRNGLIGGSIPVGNEIVSTSLSLISNNDDGFISFLESIKPCFPRFASEFHSASFMGIVTKLVSLFENSKTIRRSLHHTLGKELDVLVISSEYSSLAQIAMHSKSLSCGNMWGCSSTLADNLRRISWGTEIIGATVPHPIELLRTMNKVVINCENCQSTFPKSDHIVVYISKAFRDGYPDRGPYNPYLGSKTSETTSLIQPWERDTNVPVVRQAYKLRRSIAWFVEPTGNLANSILNNIKSLTGEESNVMSAGFKRTGSGLHRFSCTRQSTGGFSGIAPNYASNVLMTSDSLVGASSTNYDFMYQSLLIYAQVTSVTYHLFQTEGSTLHFHIDCVDCLREIQEPTLDTPFPYDFPSVSHLLEKWKPDDVKWYRDKPVVNLVVGNWIGLSNASKNYQLGALLAYYFMDKTTHSPEKTNDLFPIVMQSKIDPLTFLEGIALGLARAAALGNLRRPSLWKRLDKIPILYGSFHQGVEDICKNPSFLSLCSKRISTEIMYETPHRIPSTYPMSTEELGSLLSSHLKKIFNTRLIDNNYRFRRHNEIWIFAEFLSAEVAGPYILAAQTLDLVTSQSLTKVERENLKSIARDEVVFRSKEVSEELLRGLIRKSKIYLCAEEARHACKSMHKTPNMIASLDIFQEQFRSRPRICRVPFRPGSVDRSILQLEVPDIRDPTIAGLRLAQLATGSFLKIPGILDRLDITYHDFLCGGDGSGGISACLARRNVTARFIYNSLFEGLGLDNKGATPSPPSALAHMPKQIQARCVNYLNCWENSSDLSKIATWNYFVSLKMRYSLHVNLIVLDMQILSPDIQTRLEECIIRKIGSVLENGGTLIYKTYISRIIKDMGSFVTKLSKLFLDLYFCQSSIGGSFTSEVYVVFSKFIRKTMSHESPDWLMIDDWIRKCYCFRSVDVEFRRALNLFNKQTLLGIPKIYQPEVLDEGEGILSKMGVDPTGRTDILRLFYANQSEMMNVEDAWVGYCHIASSIIDTKIAPKGKNRIPSDPTLLKMLAFHYAMLIYTSLVTGAIDIYKLAHDELQGKIKFYYKFDEVDRDKDTFSWSFCPISQTSKIIRLDSVHGLIGRVLRWLTRNTREHKKEFDQYRLMSKFKSSENNHCKKEYIKRTGIFEHVNLISARTDDPITCYNIIE
uniref:Replicase n=1 Tax=Evros rhabdovirus 2 TaxID=2805770 RepID=A0A889IPJ1_9RHAB|nr:MAG: RNA-dependent RNA polymerase [Evros rhabdovirus 2]